MAPYGQAIMHAAHPMHRSRSMSTMPLSSTCSALTGQLRTQGAFSQWLQRMGVNARFTSGNTPWSTYLTRSRQLLTGTLFSDLHATSQALQPMHASRSTRKPRFMKRPPVARQSTSKFHASPESWPPADARRRHRVFHA
jgi:hypothetical protein